MNQLEAQRIALKAANAAEPGRQILRAAWTSLNGYLFAYGPPDGGEWGWGGLRVTEDGSVEYMSPGEISQAILDEVPLEVSA